jgi:hypothetical protein
VVKPPFRGHLRDTPDNVLHVKPEANPNGPVRMWEQPKLGHQYAMGVDTSEGIDGGDYSAAYVLDREDLSIVAAWHGLIEPELFAPELARVGRTYNDAKIGVENNNQGHTTLVTLKNLRRD